MLMRSESSELVLNEDSYGRVNVRKEVFGNLYYLDPP